MHMLKLEYDWHGKNILPKRPVLVSIRNIAHPKSNINVCLERHKFHRLHMLRVALCTLPFRLALASLFIEIRVT